MNTEPRNGLKFKEGDNIGLKKLRLACGLTQHQLAVMLGVSQRTISYIEIGERKPSTELAKRIAEIFGLSVGEMWGMFYED